MASVWTVHLEGGPQRVNHAAALVGTRIYSFGGYSTKENFATKRPMDIHVLCTLTNRWKKLPIPTDCEELKSVPYQRYGHTAVSYGTNIYIWGGRNDEAACNKLFCYDTVLQKWSCPKVSGFIPGARDGHAACIIQDKMYVTGGYIEDEQYAEDIHALDLKTMNWSWIYTKGTPVSCRDFHSATALDGKIYVFGGRGDEEEPYLTGNEVYDNNLYVYDPVTNRWSVADDHENAPIGRRSLSCFAHNHKLYMFGGYNGIHKIHYNDFHCYDTILNKWCTELVPLGEKPCQRRRQSCVPVGDRIFLFGGTSPGENYRTEDVSDNEEIFEDPERNLIDLNDLHILDLNPSLRTLCLVAVIKCDLKSSDLPHSIQMDLMWMTKNNDITKPLSRPCTG